MIFASLGIAQTSLALPSLTAKINPLGNEPSTRDP
jgi:hypothetical protein